MNKKFKNSIVVVLIICLSLGCGFVYDMIYTKVQHDKHPTPYFDEVSTAAVKYTVPSYVLYGCIKVRSDFDTGLVDGDGRTGLMQLTGEQYDTLSASLSSYVDRGLLFDPATSINLGAYWISSLYEKYKSFDAVYAAMYIGEPTVEAWLSDETLVDSSGRLIAIPDSDTEEYVKKVNKAVEIYRDIIE